MGEITYVPSDFGYPVPKKYVSNFVEPNGKVTPMLEIDFLKWERYTPTADDFDLEKQFGVKPLPKPVEATPSPIDTVPETPERNWGLWIASAALVVVTVVLFVFVWRRRRMDRGASEST